MICDHRRVANLFFSACTLLELKANCMLQSLELFPNGKASNEI